MRYKSTRARKKGEGGKKKKERCKRLQILKRLEKCAHSRYQRRRCSRERAFQSFYEMGGPKQGLHPSYALAMRGRDSFGQLKEVHRKQLRSTFKALSKQLRSNYEASQAITKRH
jgi:hypothetical protein